MPTSPQCRAPVLTPEDTSARQMVYLVTFSHPHQATSACGVPLKAPKDFERQDFLKALLDAFAHPVYAGLGMSAAHTGHAVGI